MPTGRGRRITERGTKLGNMSFARRRKLDVSNGHAPRVYSTSVADLGYPPLRLRQPLVVVVEDFGDEVVASWPEVEAWGAGSTAADAINCLKQEIAALYGELRRIPERRLGKLPRRWKQALSVVIQG